MVERVTTLPQLPPRDEESHKGTFGRVLVVAGSRGMAGAAALCGLGALRGGAGLVTVACPAEVGPVVTAVEPGLMTFPWPDRDGYLILPYSAEDGGTGEEAAFLLDEGPDGQWENVAAVGCGLGQDFRSTAVVERFWRDWPVPVVVDASGLFHLSRLGEWSKRVDHPRVLTPHPGEFARLLGGGVSAADVQADRVGLAVSFAAKFGVVLLLKGHRTLVTDGDRLYENATGNPGMATGGSGDVLTGLIAALIAQGLDAFDAACLAAHLHGRAGDLAAADLSQPGMIASDLPRYLGRAFLEHQS